MSNGTTQRFIILPPRGLRSTGSLTTDGITAFLRSFPHPSALQGLQTTSFRVGPKPKASLQVLDSIGETGAKLVEMSPEAMDALRIQQPGLQIVPERLFKIAKAPRPRPLGRPKISAKASKTQTTLQVEVISRRGGQPIAGATVVAFTDFENRLGVEAQTNSRGIASLRLGGSAVPVDRLYVFPSLGFWSLRLLDVVLSSGVLELEPLDLNIPDSLRLTYGQSRMTDGTGVKVGVVDTGVHTDHQDLTVEGGENCVLGESPTEFGDNGEGHGTHVAGIIAARGTPPTGLQGLAPGVSLFSFRVFGRGRDEATNYDISKAIDRAVATGCDLINLSLGGGDRDEAIEASIADARAAGSVVVAAAGNDDRSPVSFPATSGRTLAVSAFGRKKTFPSDAADADAIAAPFGKPQRDLFIAAFSNIGREIDLTAPGVAILSTVPGGYAAMMGTSMACPAVTGRAAQLMSKHPDLLKLPRDASRADAVTSALLQSARSLGFGSRFEGVGMP